LAIGRLKILEFGSKTYFSKKKKKKRGSKHIHTYPTSILTTMSKAFSKK